MDLDNLLNNTLEEYLLQCIIDKIEDVSELPKMLKGIGYLDRKEEYLARTTRCEVLDFEDPLIENCFESENEIHIQYEFVYILQTFIDSNFIWRVQGCAQLELFIPDTNSVDWSVFDTQNEESHNDEFFEYYEKYKEFAHFQNIVYKDIECDTIES